jgi:MFS family permease
MLENIFIGILVIAILAIVVFIYSYTYKEAVRKGRSGGGWLALAIFVAGPLFAPLLLSSFTDLNNPEDKTTSWMYVGRTIMVLLICLIFMVRIVTSLTPYAEKSEVNQTALEEHSWESEDVSEHYKKMSIFEIKQCLRFSEEISDLQANGTLVDDIYEYETEEEANLLNGLIHLYDSKECNVRTYDYSDMKIALAELKESK